ncbi:porin family protein [Aquiflexum sp.]|uniref:porin family protein n=1 Tax=Aquiflexum sp. TaxID=1872584 RepID=UPI0035945EE3
MKNFIVTLLGIIIAFSASSQDFSIGPKIGVSQANISVTGDDFVSGDDNLGYHVGLFVRMGGNSIFIQPEFLYTNTGGSFIQKQTNGTDISIDANFNRVDIPFMFGFKLADFFRLQAGPIASILIDYRIEDALQVPLDVDYNTSTIGYQAGIGFDIGNFILDLKYENSLGKISKSNPNFPTDQRQNQIIVSAGFRLF